MAAKPAKSIMQPSLMSESNVLPVSPSVLALFIAHLFDRKYAPATINTYGSAIGYSHKLACLPDPTKVFYINQMLKGLGKLHARFDTRLPHSEADCFGVVSCF